MGFLIGHTISIVKEYIAGLSKATILAMSGLVAWVLDEDEGFGTTYAGDTVGDQRRTIQPGRCYLFDGTDDYIDFGEIFDNDGTQAMSWTLWFKTDSTTSNERMIAKNEDFNIPSGWAIGHSAGAIRFIMRANRSTSNNINLTTDDDSFNDGNWHFLCITYDGSKSASGVNISIDGSSPLTFTGADNLTGDTSVSYSMSISNKASSGGTRYTGFIRDVRIFNSEITDANCLYLYTNGLSGDSIVSDFMVKCEEGAEATSYDSSGNGFHGTITNATLSTFHATDTGVNYSYANEVGYNLSGTTIIPRDESDITNDVLGNPLTYSGRVKYDFNLAKSNCLTFDGTNDYVNITNLSFGTDDFSFGGWFYLTGAAGKGILGNAATNRIFFSSADIIRFRISAANYDSTLVYPRDTWFHLVVTMDRSGNAVMYKNGVLYDTTSIAAGSADSFGTQVIGSDYFGGSLVFSGCMAGFFITPSLLTSTNAASIYNNDISTCTYFWPFSEGAQSKAYDIKSNANHGTLTNFTLANAWGARQNVYHYNIKNGFEHYDDDATGLDILRVPYKSDGTQITPTVSGYTKNYNRPSGNFINECETKLNAPECPALRVADDNKPTARLFSGASPVDIGYSDFEENFDSEAFYFSDTSVDGEYKNLLIFDEEKSGSDLSDIQDYLNQ